MAQPPSGATAHTFTHTITMNSSDYAGTNYDQAVGSMSRLSVSSSRPSRRPKTIAELAEEAREASRDDGRPLKQWLRDAENSRKNGKACLENEDLENAFVEMARAATIILERIPNHKDYRTLLSSTQRHNVGLVRLFD
jgi:hypothetical protein